MGSAAGESSGPEEREVTAATPGSTGNVTEEKRASDTESDCSWEELADELGELPTFLKRRRRRRKQPEED